MQVDTQRREFLASAEEQLRQVEAEWQGKLEAATSAHLVDRKRMALLEQDLQVCALRCACGVGFRCVLCESHLERTLSGPRENSKRAQR